MTDGTKKTYVSPQLEIFGEVAALTTSASQKMETETATAPPAAASMMNRT